MLNPLRNYALVNPVDRVKPAHARARTGFNTMPFKDQDKRNRYSRDYMRRRRAGQPQPKREPNYAAIDREIARWMGMRPHRRPGWADKVLDAMKGLDLHTDEGAAELVRVYYDARREHRAALEAREREEAAEREAREREREINRQRCNFCRHLPSTDRVIVEHGHDRVCEHCVQQLTIKVAAVRDGTEHIKRCNFCGKVRAEVRLLVHGLDGVCICDECVPGVVEIVEERAAANA